MESLQESMEEYRKQLEKGVIQQAYRGLMGYMMDLRAHFQNRYPAYSVPGSLYAGYMDMTYFSILSEPLKDRKLKVAVVYLHEACRFEAWLAGVNKQVQAHYWTRFKESGWQAYPLVATLKGADSIVECVLADRPDFCDLDRLTGQIEAGTVAFIREVERFLEG